MKYKILTVEDDPHVASLIESLLAGRDFETDMAYTGEDALEKIKGHPDLILLDRGLPDMEGMEVCRRIREDKRFRGIPIIILSAKDKIAERVEGLYIGADDYVTKPFDNSELIARIEAVLRRGEFAAHLKEEKETLVGELKRIIDQELITPFFQPIFDLATSRPLGFEVFGRPSESGPLSNPEFLFKVAINTGMYVDLEMLCWRKAIAKWNGSSADVKLFLNCSPYLIESGRFDNDLLLQQGLLPERTVLELTERIAIQDYEKLYSRINEFKKMDLGIAVDDVGCGFASLNTVAEVKPDYLKIDTPLIRSIHKDQLKQDIVHAIVHFSQKSGIITIAEGIEKEEELQKVKELGINAGQGYLLARPDKEIRTFPRPNPSGS